VRERPGGGTHSRGLSHRPVALPERQQRPLLHAVKRLVGRVHPVDQDGLKLRQGRDLLLGHAGGRRCCLARGKSAAALRAIAARAE